MSGVHDFTPASVLLNSCFLSLQKFYPLGFFPLAGHGHIVGAGSSAFAASMVIDMKRLVRSIGDHLRS